MSIFMFIYKNSFKIRESQNMSQFMFSEIVTSNAIVYHFFFTQKRNNKQSQSNQGLGWGLILKKGGVLFFLWGWAWELGWQTGAVLWNGYPIFIDCLQDPHLSPIII